MTAQRRTPLHIPLILPLWLLFFAFGGVVFLLVALHVLTLGFAKLGLTGDQVFLILAGSFFGSMINIPIKRFEDEEAEQGRVVTFFGMRYVLRPRRNKTVLAVNVGGCLVPVGVSLYVLLKMPTLLPAAAICVAVCAAATWRISRVVPGAGVAVPWFTPPLISALLAIFLAPEGMAAPVAYVTGSLGTLVGADILNLHKIKDLGAPVASIGGAGTWDGIFLSGLLASVLAF